MIGDEKYQNLAQNIELVINNTPLAQNVELNFQLADQLLQKSSQPQILGIKNTLSDFDQSTGLVEFKMGFGDAESDDQKYVTHFKWTYTRSLYENSEFIENLIKILDNRNFIDVKYDILAEMQNFMQNKFKPNENITSDAEEDQKKKIRSSTKGKKVKESMSKARVVDDNIKAKHELFDLLIQIQFNIKRYNINVNQKNGEFFKQNQFAFSVLKFSSNSDSSVEEIFLSYNDANLASFCHQKFLKALVDKFKSNFSNFETSNKSQNHPSEIPANVKFQDVLKTFNSCLMNSFFPDFLDAISVGLKMKCVDINECKIESDSIESNLETIDDSLSPEVNVSFIIQPNTDFSFFENVHMKERFTKAQLLGNFQPLKNSFEEIFIPKSCEISNWLDTRYGNENLESAKFFRNAFLYSRFVKKTAIILDYKFFEVLGYLA